MSKNTPTDPDRPTPAEELDGAEQQPARDRKAGRYSLAEMLAEIKVDAEEIAGGALLDQRRIDSIFRRINEQ